MMFMLIDISDAYECFAMHEGIYVFDIWTMLVIALSITYFVSKYACWSSELEYKDMSA